jgi:hypothetical protein
MRGCPLFDPPGERRDIEKENKAEDQMSSAIPQSRAAEIDENESENLDEYRNIRRVESGSDLLEERFHVAILI